MSVPLPPFLVVLKSNLSTVSIYAIQQLINYIGPT